MLQDVHERVLVAARSGATGWEALPYLRRAVRNRCVDVLRARAARPATVELATDLPDGGGDPAGVALDRERLAELVADLRALPDRQREALLAGVLAVPARRPGERHDEDADRPRAAQPARVGAGARDAVSRSPRGAGGERGAGRAPERARAPSRPQLPGVPGAPGATRGGSAVRAAAGVDRLTRLRARGGEAARRRGDHIRDRPGRRTARGRQRPARGPNRARGTSSRRPRPSRRGASP